MTPENKILIVTDSTCDLPRYVSDQWGIKVMPATIRFGQTAFVEGVDIDREKFYAELAKPNHEMPKTSVPSVGDFITVYEAHPGPVCGIFAAENLTGFLNTSHTAAIDMGRKNVENFNSGTTSLGLGFADLLAAHMAAEGASVTDITVRLHDQIARTCVFAYADTLIYLRESGRVDKVQAGLGSLLDLKPLLQIKDGKIIKRSAVRTKKPAIAKLLELAHEYAPFERIGVMHANSEELARAIAKDLQSEVDSEIMVVPITTGVTVHIGPGAIGIAVVKKQT